MHANPQSDLEQIPAPLVLDGQKQRRTYTKNKNKKKLKEMEHSFIQLSEAVREDGEKKDNRRRERKKK